MVYCICIRVQQILAFNLLRIYKETNYLFLQNVLVITLT
jgi:hypothetical protein